MTRPRVFLDACVLYPPLVRELVLAVAGAGAITAFWSPRVLEEWRIATARKQGPEAMDLIEERIAALHRDFPEASVAPDPVAEAVISLPDPADAHVLAGAMAARAEVLVTFNLRDFPARALSGTGITARHPDGFLWELLGGDPDPGPAIHQTLSTHEIPPDRARAALKRARLPRLGKAWAGQG